MAMKITAGYDIATGKTVETVVLELVKAHGRDCVAGITDLTDSSGGTADSSAWTLLAASEALVNVADSSTSSAQKAATETAMGTVKNALLELFTKANEYATKLGIDNVTYSGGGTAADGTVSAVTVAVTAATTGVQATETNAFFSAVNLTTYKLAVLVNKLANALGVTPLVHTAIQDTFASTVALIAADGGTAADPAVSKAAVDAELVKVRTNVATIAAKLNALNAGLGNAAVVVV